MTLANSGSSVTVSNTETITGGTGADIVTLAPRFTGAINLNAGADSLTLSSAGNNTLTLSNVETVVGGSLDDKITLGTAVTAGVIDLGGGADSLTLAQRHQQRHDLQRRDHHRRHRRGHVTLAQRAGFRHRRSGRRRRQADPVLGRQQQLTVSNTETITGGSQDDSVTLATAVTAGVINLGAGTDTLNLRQRHQQRDDIERRDRRGGSGTDTITLGNVANTSTFSNIET